MTYECECGEPVSHDWYRVWNIDGEVKFCPDCKTTWERNDGLKEGEFL